jgi:hypothetical protein
MRAAWSCARKMKSGTALDSMSGFPRVTFPHGGNRFDQTSKQENAESCACRTPGAFSYVMKRCANHGEVTG